MSSGFTPTQEQEAVVDYFPKKCSFKISAFAGTGKTSTLKLLGDTYSNEKLAYLAFNKKIAQEAKNKFSKNVTCQTFHSLAYHSVPSFIQSKLNHQRYMPSDVGRDFRLFTTELPLAKQPDKTGVLNSWEQGIILCRAVDNFCRSSDKNLKITHVLDALPPWVNRQKSFEYASQIVGVAQSFWDMCISEKYDFKITPDVYLKYWSMQNPIIRADRIFLDEAQDADPIMLNILKNQNIPIILVGDRNQQIYSWRGALNAMQSVKIPEFYLTKSFRFGQSIADNANLILNNILGERKRIIGNEKIVSKIGVIDQPDAILARTNSSAFEMAVLFSQMGVKVKIDVDSTQLLGMIDDFEKLRIKVPVEKSSPFFGFRDWIEVVMFVEMNPTSELGGFVRLVQKNDPGLLRAIINNLANPDEYDCVIMTAHKSKGLEFGKVTLVGDFKYSLEPNKELISVDEARLLYVAATRAIDQLDISQMDELFSIAKVLR